MSLDNLNLEDRIPIKLIIFEEDYKFDIEDKIQLPEELKKPDLNKIGHIVKESKGKKRIPGVRTRVEYVCKII